MQSNKKPHLIVEDDSMDIRLMERCLKKNLLDKTVHVARDGRDALDYIFGCGPYSHFFENDSLKLIILDLQLPKYNGHEILEKVKSKEETKEIPVAVFTSSSAKIDEIRSYEAGANSFNTKPVDSQEFCKLLIRLIQSIK